MGIVRRGRIGPEGTKELHQILLDAVGDKLAENRDWRSRMYDEAHRNPRFIRYLES